MNVYTLTQAQGGEQTLVPGPDFTSFFQRIDTAEESADADGAPIGSYVEREVQHSYADLDGYDDALLARWKITRTVVADPPPPVVRRELPKSTIVARVNTIGKLAEVFGIIQSSPLLFAQWFSPDWPNVYVDDAGMLQVLAAAGLTSGEIAQVVA